MKMDQIGPRPALPALLSLFTGALLCFSNQISLAPPRGGNMHRVRCLLALSGWLALAWLPAWSQLECPPCDDANTCTVDSCDTTTGTCRYDPVSCDDGNPCTQDSCSPIPSPSTPCGVVGCCNRPLNNVSCDDGNSCTQGDFCSSGHCSAFVLPQGSACDDRNSCTDLDSCNGETCVGQALAVGTLCSDDNACTSGDTCGVDAQGAPTCQGSEVDCSDHDTCTQDLCNPATGACSNPPIDCDDGNPCTSDTLDCKSNPVCLHAPQSGSCQDTDLCSPDDFCSSGICVRSGTCDDHIDCTVDRCIGDEGCYHVPNDSLCIPPNGQCVTFADCHPQVGCIFRFRVGDLCIPENLCRFGVCDYSGHCLTTGDERCYDGNVCTQDFCNAATGACSYSNDTGNVCCAGSLFNPAAGEPQVTIDSVSPTVLLPSNHKLVPITLAVTAKTQCGTPLTAMLVSVTSNQPDDAPGPGDGHTTQDIQDADLGQPDTSILLRAERDRDLGERVYTITYAATANGSIHFAVAEVRVPASRRSLQKQKPAPRD